MMLATLIKKELLVNFTNLRFSVCSLATFVLIVFSMVIRGLEYEAEYREYRAGQNRRNEALSEEHNRPEDFKNYDMQLAPKALSVFCAGFNGDIARPFNVSVNMFTRWGGFEYRDPLLVLHRIFDTCFIIMVMMSLLSLFLNYDIVSGEIESGTLRLTLANPVSRNLLIWGKLIGGYLSLVLPLVFSLLVAVLALAGFTGLTFSGGEWLRFGIILGIAFCYVALFFFIGLLMSLLVRNSMLSLICAVTAWIALVIAVPDMSAPVSALLQRVPSSGELLRRNQALRTQERARQQQRFDAAPNLWQKNQAWIEAARGVRTRWFRELDEHNGRLETQISLGTRLARFSPAASFMYMASNVAGTGMLDYLDAKTWKRNFIRQNAAVYFNEVGARRYIANRLGQDVQKALEAPMRLDYLPDMDYRGLPLEKALAASQWDILTLLLECLLLFMLSYLMFLKVKV